MCGIVGYTGFQDAYDIVINGLRRLEYRGYDSSGLAYVKNKKVIVKKEVGRVSNLEKKINTLEKTNIGIAHTRWATHGNVTKTNSHPHKEGDIVLVHNGIIENYLLLTSGY